MTWQDIPGRLAFGYIYSEFIAQAPRDALIVEVGVGLGKSLLYAAEKCVEMGRTDITVVGVDPWAGTARNGEQQASGPPTPDGDFELFKRMMAEHTSRAADKIWGYLRMPSIEAPPEVIERFGRRPNLVVIDADHEYHAVKEDIETWRRVLAPGGWMGGDDYMPEFPGVIRAVNEAFQWDRLEVRYDFGWGSWLVR